MTRMRLALSNGSKRFRASSYSMKRRLIVFAEVDTDDNGAIDVQEKAAINPDLPDLVEFIAAFEAIDLNGNNELAPREFAKAQQVGGDAPVSEQFAELDYNEDGAISRREFYRYDFPGGREPSRDVKDHVFNELDVDDDRELSPKEFEAPLPPPPPGAKGKAKKGKGKGKGEF